MSDVPLYPCRTSCAPSEFFVHAERAEEPRLDLSKRESSSLTTFYEKVFSSKLSGNEVYYSMIFASNILKIVEKASLPKSFKS